jgi:hypothetical protein
MHSAECECVFPVAREVDLEADISLEYGGDYRDDLWRIVSEKDFP